MDYQYSGKDLNHGKYLPISWNLGLPNQEIHDRSDYIFLIDSMLDNDTIASVIMEKYSNFSYRFCYLKCSFHLGTKSEINYETVWFHA